MKNVLVLFSILCSIVVFGQGNLATVKGTVFDDENVIYEGATVELVGFKKMLTDANGVFEFVQVPAGTYSLKVTTADFPDFELPQIKVENGKTIPLTVKLKNDTELDVVKIRVHQKVKQDGDVDATSLQNNNDAISDVVSGDRIKNSNSSNATGVIKMSAGASIQDNKFAVIRGLNDRYNTAILNGAPLPSTESDRKAFAFDMFPATMLDNMVIDKTATPDMPAEFAGGIIQINTKGIPDSSFQSIQIGGSYNSITTFKKRTTYEGGALDWIGVDNGSRAMPSAIPAYGTYPTTITDQANLATQFSTSWSLIESKYSPNYNLQYAAGIRKDIGKREFGFITALTYSRTFNYNETVRNGYTNGTDATAPSILDYTYLDHNNNEQILAGALANFMLKLNEKNNISFKNIYTINSDDKLIQRTGEINPLDVNPTLLRSSARWFTSNSVYSGQLAGDHELGKSRFKLSWMTAYSKVNRVIPSLRRTIYTRNKYVLDPNDPNALDTTYVANMSYSSVGPNYSGGMFFSENNEHSINNRMDLQYSFDETKPVKSKIKVGVYSQLRNRTFEARQLGYTKYGIIGGNVTFDESLLYLPEDQIYAQENMGLLQAPANGNNGIGGFKLTDGTKFSDAYTAQSKLNAGYLQAEHDMASFKFVYGVRAEFFEQNLQAKRDDNSDLSLQTKKLDILPSFNGTYKIDARNKLRFSYSQTLNRPEYRELAPFAFYDFTTNFVVSGNDSLQRAKINNLDVKFERYPGKGQLLSAAVFYKHFSNSIEQISRADVTGEITYKNVPTATNFGVELEARSVLSSFISCDSTSILNALTVYSNLSVIRSSVDVSQIVGSASDSRPLQGQSPYVVNVGITFRSLNEKWISSLNLNRVGERIAIVGNVNEPDLWENARTFLDWQGGYNFLNGRAQVKLSLSNILAQDQLFYQNNSSDQSLGWFKQGVNSTFIGNKNNTNGYQKGIDDEVWRTNFGRTISCSISLKF